jgi:processive 1,2-diacylglycerol beta-glucosyltransferase
MKKILILTSEFGKGHMSVAKHLQTALNDTGKCEAKIVDFGQYAKGPFSHSHKSYDTATKHVPKAWQIFFDLTNEDKTIHRLGKIQLKMTMKNGLNLFKKEKPDLIVITFAGWVYTASQIAKKYDPKLKVVSLTTDSISIHRTWTLGDIDELIVPDTDTAETVIEGGIDPKIVHALGYPVNPALFDKKFDKAKFTNNLNFDPNKKTVLFIPTLLNKQKTLDLIQLIIDKAQYNLAVICGRDKELHKKLLHHERDKNFHLEGWTDKMPEYMLASDVVITKAGGSTVQECIAAKKPMILNQIVPGQEQGNALYVEKNKLGLVALTNREIISSLDTVIKNYSEYLKNLKKVSSSDAARKIAQYLLSLD